MNYLSNKQIKKLNFKKIGHNVLISKKASIINPSKIQIGSYSRIDDFSLLYGSITIGKNVHITPMCLVGAGDTEIVIGDFSTLAYGVKIFSQTDDYLNGSMTNSTVHEKFKKTTRKKIVIEKHVIIGANTVIFPGCTIKEGTSVGAMSLINQNTKSWGVYFGIPAKLKKKRKIIPKILVNKFLKLQK